MPRWTRECTNACTHTVVNEVASLVRLTAAVSSLRGSTTRVVGNRIESISTTRLVFFWATMTVRLAVAITLGWGMQARTPVDTHARDLLAGGTVFLANTIGLGDIILNSVGLAERFA